MRNVIRKPSLEKSLKARTTGRVKRTFKNEFDPVYGQTRMGLRHPKRAAYNAVYHRTSIDGLEPVKHRRRSAADDDSSDGSWADFFGNLGGLFSSAAGLIFFGFLLYLFCKFF